MSVAANATRCLRIRGVSRTFMTSRSSLPAAMYSTGLRAPIQRHLGRAIAVTTAARSTDHTRTWAISSIVTAGVISWQLANSVVEAEAPVRKDVVVDPDSKAEFPLTILSEDGSPARLLGLGVRKITFLKVQVYTVGLYMKSSDLDDHNSRFRALPEVQKFQQADQASAETAFRTMVQTPIEMILRIAPIRNTNGPHLRDGFTRNLTQVVKDQKLSETETQDAMDGIMEFKSLFPKGKINVGQAMYFRKMADGTMVIQLDEEVLGTVRNGWVIESFFMGYLDGQKPLSERAWTSIAQGIQDLLLQ